VVVKSLANDAPGTGCHSRTFFWRSRISDMARPIFVMAANS
jgi:hypothetical protein